MIRKPAKYKTNYTCRDCKAPIPHKARKCTKCNSYQGCRWYLNISTTTLALMVALLSLVPPAISAIGKILPKKDNIHVHVIEAKNRKVTLVVINSGSRAAVIAPTTALTPTGPTKTFPTKLLYDSKHSNTDLVLAPKEIQIFTATLPSNYTISNIPSDEDAKNKRLCSLILAVTPMEGYRSPAYTRFGCNVSVQSPIQEGTS